MVITALAVPSTRLLGLGSKLYPGNIPRMLNRDVTRLMQSLSRYAKLKVEQGKERHCWQRDFTYHFSCKNATEITAKKTVEKKPLCIG